MTTTTNPAQLPGSLSGILSHIQSNPRLLTALQAIQIMKSKDWWERVFRYPRGAVW